MFNMACYNYMYYYVDKVHYCDVIVFNTHDIAHVIILPLEICTIYTTRLTHNTFNNDHILCEGYALFIFYIDHYTTMLKRCISSNAEYNSVGRYLKLP